MIFSIPWGKEDEDLLAHHQSLGKLRRDYEALRQGNIHFFQAGEGRIGFKRTVSGSTLRIYVNLKKEPWDVPAGNLLLDHKVRKVAPTWLSIDPMGFCVTEDV